MLVILAILCFPLQVHSVSIQSKYYTYGYDLVVGGYFFDQNSLLFTNCARGNNDTRLCRLSFESNVFNELEFKLVCKITLTTLRPDAYFSEILEVNFWSNGKAILSWREISNSNSKEGWIHFKAVNLMDCTWTTNTVAITNEDFSRPHIFVTPYDNNYEVSFSNVKICSNKFCKLTINAMGEASDPVAWFPNTDTIFYVVPIDNDSSGRKLVITISYLNSDLAIFSCAHGDDIITLVEYEHLTNLAWSTSNGLISICGPEQCRQFNHEGKLVNEINFQEITQPSEFFALHNLPNNELLAVICENENSVNTENDYYLIIMIGANGRQGYGIKLDLECSEKPNYAFMEFFENSNINYCLTLFYYASNLINNKKRSKFSKYCFTPQDFFLDKY